MRNTTPWRPTGTARANWRDAANCRHYDPEMFFPVGTTGPALEQIEAAKGICAECVVRVECLAWALDSGQGTGIWGGTTAEERHLLRAVPRQRSGLSSYYDDV